MAPAGLLRAAWADSREPLPQLRRQGRVLGRIAPERMAGRIRPALQGRRRRQGVSKHHLLATTNLLGPSSHQNVNDY